MIGVLWGLEVKNIAWDVLISKTPPPSLGSEFLLPVREVYKLVVSPCACVSVCPKEK